MLTKESSFNYQQFARTETERGNTSGGGKSLHSSIRVVAARFTTQGENRFSMRAMLLRMRGIFPNGDVTQKDDYVVAIMNADNFSSQVQESLIKLVERENACIGISWVFSDISKFRVHYEQAVACINLSESFGMCRGIYKYDDFFFYDLLSTHGAEDSLSQFIMPEIEAIKKYDKKHFACLEKTLKIFLDCGGNALASSRILFIHRNTLLYRLRHIQKLTGLDLNNPLVRIQVHASMTIDHFLQRPDSKSDDGLRSISRTPEAVACGSTM